MVAPNGARRGKADHPALPVTIGEIVAAAQTSHAAGAGGLHAHVRDAEGQHVLDAGLYSELIAEMARVVPAMLVQITTEAVGRYGAEEQRALIHAVMPTAVSVALGEMVRDGDPGDARRFYHWAAEAGIAVQHILYEPADLTRLQTLISTGVVPDGGTQLLFVLGRYSVGQKSNPDDLLPWLDVLGRGAERADWAVCAFGQAETACLDAALRAGGKARVGFENNLHNADGSLARDNAERVKEIAGLRR
jgi:uncharacterized protein (DUF849 family)